MKSNWKNHLEDQCRTGTFEVERFSPHTGDRYFEEFDTKCRLVLEGSILANTYVVQCHVFWGAMAIPLPLRRQEYSFMMRHHADAIRKALLDFDRFCEQINALPRVVHWGDPTHPCHFDPDE